MFLDIGLSIPDCLMFFAGMWFGICLTIIAVRVYYAYQRKDIIKNFYFTKQGVCAHVDRQCSYILGRNVTKLEFCSQCCRSVYGQRLRVL